jgi:hypothetical protein
VLALAIGSALALGTQFFVARLQLLSTIGEPMAFGQMLANLDDTLLLVLTSWLAFPLLALTLGIALAQGSAASYGNVDYKLARFYEELSAVTLKDFNAKLPNSVSFLMDRFMADLANVQRGRFAAATARRLMFDAARLLRQLAATVEGNDFDYMKRAAHIESAVGARHLKATIDSEGAVLTAGERYVVSMRFVELGPMNAETLPGANYVGGIYLTLHLFGEGICVEERTLSVYLPAVGQSSDAVLHIRALDSGPCALRIFVTEERKAEVLQSLLVELPVITSRPPQFAVT